MEKYIVHILNYEKRHLRSNYHPQSNSSMEDPMKMKDRMDVRDTF